MSNGELLVVQNVFEKKKKKSTNLISRPQNLIFRSRNEISGSTQLRVTRFFVFYLFFFHYNLETSTTNYIQIVTGLL